MADVGTLVHDLAPIVEMILRLLARPKGPAPAPIPTQGGGSVGRLPDDEHISAPPVVTAVAARPVRVTLALRQAQYNRGLFPEQYTEANPFGLYADPMGMVSRDEAFNRLSKLWFDLTAFDADGRELGGTQLTAAGLAYRTEHNFTAADGESFFIRGKGQRPDGRPEEWEQRDGAIGFGQQSWIDSLGCNVAAKAWGEGTFTAVGSIGDVASNSLRFRVS